MKSKTLKRCIIVLSSCVIILFTYNYLRGCAGGYDIDIPDMSLFSPGIINQPQYVPFFLSYKNYYNDSDAPPDHESKNLEDWNNYFKGAIPSGELHWLIYIASDEVIAQLQNYYKTKVPLPDSLVKFVAPVLHGFGTAKHALACLEYLQLAKKASAIATVNYYDWEPATHDTVAAESLIGEVMKLYQSAADEFLKSRYAFQIIRLYYFADRYEDGVKFYDTKIASKQQPKTFTSDSGLTAPKSGSIYYRTLGYKAACCYRLKKYADANYIYSVLYDQYEPLRISSFWSFHPWEDADWNQCLALAKTPREKEVLWQLFGIYADPAKGIKEIYAINPASDLMDLLIVRAVNIYEASHLKYLNDHNQEIEPGEYVDAGETYTDSYKSWSSLDSVRTEELCDFLKTASENRLFPHPDLALTSAAYLQFLQNDFKESKQLVKAAERKLVSDSMAAQLKIVEMLDEVATIEKIDARAEEQLATLLNELIRTLSPPAQNSVKYIKRLLSEKYIKQNDLLKAELCFGGQGKFSTDELMTYFERKDHSRFEKYLIDQYPFKLFNIYEQKAVELMYAYNFQDAVKMFEKDLHSGEEQLYGNPFNIHITDCHDCDHAAVQKKKYSKYEFAKTMMELLMHADSSMDSSEKAENYFLYANGLYNMSYYGNARMVHETYIDTWNYDGYYNEDIPKEESADPYYNCSQALTYYQLAAAFATKKEFAAKCTWMCAKCEQNIGEYPPETDVNLWSYFVAGKYFNVMKEKYSDTRYYQDVIKRMWLLLHVQRRKRRMHPE
jgi:hypothetical protein